MRLLDQGLGIPDVRVAPAAWAGALTEGTRPETVGTGSPLAPQPAKLINNESKAGQAKARNGPAAFIFMGRIPGKMKGGENKRPGRLMAARVKNT